MFKINDKTIYITNGDTATLTLTCDNGGTFESGDIINLYLMEPNKITTATKLVEYEVEEGSGTSTSYSYINLPIDGDDLRDFVGYINQPVTYWYEIELIKDEKETTLIGYDEDGGKEFIVYPEAIA